MKWEMEVDEIEAVHEKVLDLHDKLSEAIHSISRSHFLKSRKKKTDHGFDDLQYDANNGNQVKSGFVFVKEFRINNEDENAVHDAKSLDAIRTALENLEDQLEFYNILQSQQRAERDAALARLEQSRIILAMRLSEYQGRKYKFIEDARALVGDVHDASQFVSPEKHDPTTSTTDKKFVVCDGKRPNAIFKVILSCLNFVKKSLKVDQVGGILGNAALVAISMLTLMHLQQVAGKEKYDLNLPFGHEDVAYHRNLRSNSQPERSSSGHLTHLDVLSARG